MRIDELTIRAFGHFTDYEIPFDPAKNFHLLFGPNEAGKSTTLRSITNFLYGFPTQTSDTFLHSNGKLRIEGQLKKANGETLQFARRKGNKNTVLDMNGNALNEDLLNNFLNGITKDHFLNMFALDHVRLREGGESLLQSGGNLGESLFSAASGISMLRKVFEDLEKKSAEIYKKRASTTKLNKLLKEEKDLVKEISEYQLKIQAWKELERNYNDGKKEIEAIIQQVKSLGSNREKLQRVNSTLPKIGKLRDLEQELIEMGDVPNLPENITQLRQEAQQKLENAKKDKKRAEDELDEQQTELNKLTIPDGLIEQGALIDALYREVQGYQNNRHQLPILEAKRQQLEDQIIALMKEIDMQNADLEKIDLFRLPAEKKETIRKLSKQKPLLDQAMEKLQSEQTEINGDLERKETELSILTDLPNIEELEIVIDKVKRAGQIEEMLHTLGAELRQKEQQINEEMRLLPQWDGTYQELMVLPVPGLTETVKKFEQDHHDILQKLEKVHEQIRTQQEAIEGHEERIRALESLAEIPSEDKLFGVRTRRNQGWHFIRTKLEQGEWNEVVDDFTNGQPIVTVYEENIRHADDIADKMRVEAAKVGEKNKHLSDIVSSKAKITELEVQEANAQKELVTWETAWHELWKPANIIPYTPQEMKEWLEKYHQIKGLVHEFTKANAAYAELEDKRNQLKQALLSALSQFATVSAEKTVEELLTIAEQHQKKIRDDYYKRNSLETSIEEMKPKLTNIARKQVEIETKLRNWTIEWGMAIQGTNISDTTPASVAEGLLGKYENIVTTFNELKKVEKDQSSIQEQLTLFAEKVNNLLQILPVNLDGNQVDIAVNQLNAALKQAQQDQVAISKISAQLKKLQMIIKNANHEIEAAEAVLTGFIHQAGCQTILELETVERTFIQKREVERILQETKNELLRLGNGRSLIELMDEAEGVDQDRIRVDLEEIQHQLDELEPVRSQKEQAHGVVRKEYEEKILGNNTSSVIAEQKKASILAQLANLTEQYIQLKLASSLLQKGIEHYRSQNQDPILKRASDLFARLTLQSFVGLTVDYDEKDQPVLMGIRANGDKVSIDGMSDGTTDQLYLALRIASIEKYTAENEPIPFIVDDILVHFDDTRSKETLKILLELSQQTQIIFFTHHERLVDIMNEIASKNSYQLTKINGQTVTV